eukprot:7247919-Alexandrium_andersonii.AAC.1
MPMSARLAAASADAHQQYQCQCQCHCDCYWRCHFSTWSVPRPWWQRFGPGSEVKPGVKLQVACCSTTLGQGG